MTESLAELRASLSGDVLAPSDREYERARLCFNLLIDRAERRGLVERSTAPHDGRAVHVRLTAEGRRLTEQLTAKANEALSGLLDALPERDRARLSALAGVVVRHHAASRGADLATHRA